MKCPNCGHEFAPPEIRLRLHWRGGKVQDVQGLDIADAMCRAGIGVEALMALDYWETLPEEAKP